MLFHIYWKKYLQDKNIPFNADNRTFFNAIKHEFKFLKRFFIFFISGQLFHSRSEIGKEKKILLWAYSNNSLGDSIMDLAPRVMFEGLDVDLYIQRSNAVLFKEDRHFKRVFSSLEDAGKYDLILLDLNSSKNLKKKIRYFRKTPFVPIHGFFYGFEFNRTLFQFARFEEILKVKYKKRRQPALFFDMKIEYKGHICFAIGGKDDRRTYRQWIDVIEKITEKNIVMVGSENGLEEAHAIEAKFPWVNNQVGKLQLRDTCRVIAESKMLFTSDGGLMHIGLSYNIPTIAIFVEPFRPDLRFTPGNNRGIYHKAISEVKLEEICSAYKSIKQSITAQKNT